jgi:hypothetical protein
MTAVSTVFYVPFNEFEWPVDFYAAATSWRGGLAWSLLLAELLLWLSI